MNSPTSPISGGFILLARKIVDSALMDKPPHYLKLWVWMLARANWKDRDKLKRGQFVTTIAEMQEAGGYKVGYRLQRLTRDEVRSAYEAFTKATMITTAKTTRGMVITICNFEHYQNPKNYEAHNEPHDDRTTKPHTTPHDTEEREERNIKPSPESLRLSGLLADLILSNNPKHTKLNNGSKESTVSRWAADIDKLLRIDHQDPETVERVIRWCQADSFWKVNILSGAKLREKWDQLTAKMQAGAKVIPMFQSEELNLIGEEIPA